MAKVLSVTNMTGHLQNQLTKSLERILEEAHLSGELKLSGRKLKDFPKTNGKYDLRDTVIADLSKNKFWELPPEVLHFLYVEKLQLYHNTLRSLPDGLGCLQSLKFLDLSRNQLCILPAGICQLQSLEVLLISNNKLTTLPDDIGSVRSLMELDASCNEITHLPRSLGLLKNLKSLDLRKNLLMELPLEITYLQLTILNMSENRISALPTELKQMTSLESLKLNDNPLRSPPASICMRGRVHIFKYLETQSLVSKNDVKKTHVRKICDVRYTNGVVGDCRNKRYTVDSGYSTSDGVDNKWIQDFQKFDCDNTNTTKVNEHEDGIPDDNVNCSNCSTPSTISPGGEDDVLLTQDQVEARRLIRLQSTDKHSPRLDKSTPNGELLSSPGKDKCGDIVNGNGYMEERKTLEHIQTYREYKEALKQQRAQSQDVYRPRLPGDPNLSPTSNENHKITDELNHYNKKPVQKVTPNSRNMNGNSVPSYVKPSSPVRTGTPASPPPPPPAIVAGVPTTRSLVTASLQPSNKPRTGSPRPVKWNTDVPPEKLSFTMRREFEKAKEEAELIEQLRNHIEQRLKMSLPDDLGPALMDGVVLCHLANHVRPRSVASIHVPSPAVPKLTMARCRRNVDNFLDACRKIGVEENLICCASDVLEGRGLVQVSITVSEILRFHTPKSPAHSVP